MAEAGGNKGNSKLNEQNTSTPVTPRRFSVNYCASSQQSFLNCLRDGKYDDAFDILMSMRGASSQTEQIERIIAVGEGYRMLAAELLGYYLADEQHRKEEERGDEDSSLGIVLRNTSL